MLKIELPPLPIIPDSKFDFVVPLYSHIEAVDLIGKQVDGYIEQIARPKPDPLPWKVCAIVDRKLPTVQMAAFKTDADALAWLVPLKSDYSMQIEHHPFIES